MDSLQAPGMVVGSNVRLKYLLGQGGMGSIWVADHLNLQIEVAVKFLNQQLADMPEARARFQREAAAAAQLKSPHVVQILDYGLTQTGVPYIVMELLTGEDLAQHIERLGPRPLGEVVEVVFQVARALAVAHARGVVHRDIKPENVFLTGSESDVFVKLLDFGIAKRTEDASMNVTNTNFMLGTPQFMSPEQLMNPKTVDFRTDLWSVAVVAYAALTAKLPFHGDTVGALCVAVNAGEFPSVTSIRPDLPAALDLWFERALRHDPARRFPSIQELATALEVSAGVGEPRRLSSTDLTGAASGRRPFSSAPPPVQADPTRHSSSFNASITHAEPEKKSQLPAVVMIVLTSVISSVITTVLVMDPSSLGRLLDAISGRTLPDAEAPAGLAASPPAEGVDAEVWSKPPASRSAPSSEVAEPSAAPSSPAPPPKGESAQGQANTSEAKASKPRSGVRAPARPRAKPAPKRGKAPEQVREPGAGERSDHDYGL